MPARASALGEGGPSIASAHDNPEGAIVDVLLPRDTVSDDACKLVEIHVSKGQDVKSGDVLFTFESSKSTFEVPAEADGVIDWDELVVDEFYPIGEPVATIAGDGSETTKTDQAAAPVASAGSVQVRSHAAEQLVAAGHPVPATTLGFLGSADLRPSGAGDAEETSPSEAIDGGDLPAQLQQLRARMRQQFDRHVPTGTLLHDRWGLAKSWGFGDGASCYDECLILGDVEVGCDVWIGPFTILDGAHAKLTIGDQSSIGAGTHVYTHDTIAHTLTGGASPHAAATTIGNNCFISPHVVIAPGHKAGRSLFVAAGAYVQGVFPPGSYIAGNPAVRAGEVEITDSGFRIQKTTGPGTQKQKQ